MDEGNSDWQGKVYHLPEEDFYSSLEWKKLREDTLMRDNLTCLRCEKKYKIKGRYLTAHHVIPRLEGGADDLSNLVTLCDKCHDFVEMHSDLRSKAAIIGSLETDNLGYIKVYQEGEVDKARPDWHAWVYGGARNPMLDKRLPSRE